MPYIAGVNSLSQEIKISDDITLLYFKLSMQSICTVLAGQDVNGIEGE